MSGGVREEILEPLHRVTRWMAGLRDAQNRIMCPEHHVEHTGKSAGVITLACELIDLDPRADRNFLFELALSQARRLAASLMREGTSPCHTFRPGRHDPFNCSNSVIDGGAASDALCDFVARHGNRLDARDRESFQYAGVLHARTYLRYAVVDKGIPAQRAWGLTGLASALALEPDELMENAFIQAVAELAAVQHEDGSYPYHPLEWGAGHPGASDVSSFYQSRVTGFLFHALERTGRDPKDERYRAQLVRGLEFLAALHGPDGIKVGLVEAKPWYWGATYEVASHPFDVYALVQGYKHFRTTRFADAARRAFAAWVRHISPEGVIRSHDPGPGRGRSYQCPVFWAGHASWMARAARDLEEILRSPETQRGPRAGIDLRIAHFPSAQLTRLEDDAVVAWIRGSRPRVNVSHGSPHGAGLLRCVRKSDGSERIARCRLGGHQPGEWSGHHGLPSPVRGWRSGKKELRFSFWLARTHWRAGRRRDALLAPLRMFSRGVLAFAHSRVSSAFDLAPETELLPDGVVLRSRLAHRDGSAVEASRIERVFRLDGEGLDVLETLRDDGGASGARFQMPGAAEVVSQSKREIRYRLS